MFIILFSYTNYFFHICLLLYDNHHIHAALLQLLSLLPLTKQRTAIFFA